MVNNRCSRSNIVPGRKMITTQVAYYQAGISENISYLAEKTVVEDSSIFHESHDNEEREWKKQGLSEKEIYDRLRDKKLKKLRNAENRLNKEKFGATNFLELLNRHEYSERESDDEETATVEMDMRNVAVFAIPALPKHLSEKSILGSPVSGSKGSGKAGLSCSTPKSANDLSMRSLRALDISHVVSVDQLDVNRVTIQSKNILIPIAENAESSSLQKTHTIQDISPAKTCTIPDHSLMKTHTITRDLNTESKNERMLESSLQKTYTIPDSSIQKGQCSQDASLQKTFTIQDSSLQKTFTVPDSSVRKTYVVSNSSPSVNHNVQEHQSCQLEDEGNEMSLQKTFDVDEQDTTSNGTFRVRSGWKNTLLDSLRQDREECVQNYAKDNGDLLAQPLSASNVLPVIEKNKLQGGEKRISTKKTSLQEREKRAANSSLMSSMIEDIPSPGAGLFKNTRKKLRPTNSTPQRMKNNRLSMESDKEKTIDMLSIAEEISMENETNGSSFVDPISINDSRVSPVIEDDEPMDISKNEATPKSRRHTSLNATLREKVTAQSTMATPATSVNIYEDKNPSDKTPKHHYQKPTFSSLVKNKNAADSNDLLEASKINRRNTPRRNAQINGEGAFLSDGDGVDDVRNENIAINGRNDDRLLSVPVDISSPSMTNLRLGLDEMTVRDASSINRDYDAVDHIDQYTCFDNFNADSPEESEKESDEAGPSIWRRSSRRRVELLSDSVASVNNSGIEIRSTSRNFMNDSIFSETWQPGEVSRKNSRGGKNKNLEMQLKKREIIQPASPQEEVRRSKRTRVKPVRSWLGEKPVYVNSPSGGKRLTGVTDVIIRDKRLCKYRTADLKLATEREQKEKARKKIIAAERRRKLAADQSRGRRLDESQEDIHTDDD